MLRLCLSRNVVGAWGVGARSAVVGAPGGAAMNWLPGARGFSVATGGSESTSTTAPHADATSASLLDDLQTIIRVRGPMPLSQFMTHALTHPEHGYYMKRDVFGTKGDFTTAPEISQMFGELVGVWCTAMWKELGSPPHVRLVELGPGRGTLMNDIVRAASQQADFADAMSVHMVEVSVPLRRIQQTTMGCVASVDPDGADEADGAGGTAAAAEVAAGAAGTAGEAERTGASIDDAESKAEDEADAPPTVDGGKVVVRGDLSESKAAPPLDTMLMPCSGGRHVTAQWHEAFSDVPDGPILVVAQEFFDALPIHHFTFTERGWCETMVDIQAAAEGTAAAADATSMKGPVGSRAIDATPTADVGPGGKPLDEQDGDSPLRMVLSAGPTAAAKLYLSHRASSVPSSLGEDVDGDTGVAGVAAGAINRRSEHNNPKPATANSQFDADHGDMIEVGAVGASIMQEITRRVASDGGAALIVDYGKDQASTSSLRGIYDHKFVDVLDRPGDVDLSADVDFSALREATRAALAGMLTAVDESEKFSNAAVDANKASPLLNAQGVPMERDPSAAIIDDDFGPIPTSDDATRARNQIQAVRVVGPVSQGDFLLGMGIRERLEMLMDRYPEELTEDQAEELGTLIDSYNRLVDPKEMGSEYKVFAISSNGKVPVAF